MQEFKTLDELYKRLSPAFDSKIRELHNRGYHYIKKEDIWNYLSLNVWSKSSDLSLYKMVEDIFDLSEDKINTYVLNILSKESRNIKEMDVL